MKSTPPQLSAPSIVFGASQDEFEPITGSLVTHPSYGTRDHTEICASVIDPELPCDCGSDHNSVVYAFELDELQKAQIVAGAHLYVSLLTFGGRPQGLLLHVGPEEPAALYGCEVTP